MCLLGLFRDVDRDERFVWIRGFRDMEERLAALQAFYGPRVARAQRRGQRDHGRRQRRTAAAAARPDCDARASPPPDRDRIDRPRCRGLDR